MNYRGVIAYCGTPYFGFKKTKMGPNVEEVLQQCLERILQHPVKIQGASLTDRGVHAEGQVIQFTSPRVLHLEKVIASLRALLPKTIVLLDLIEASPDFHPSLDATHKEYHYAICNSTIQLPPYREFSWHIPFPLNLKHMELAIPHIVGKRDFSAFANRRYDDAVRHLQRISIVSEDACRLRIEVEGDRFLYKMVRNIVGTLAWIGVGKLCPFDVASIVSSCDRRQAGVTAPAHGLVLKRVYY